MGPVAIVEAVRTPIGRRSGALSKVHPNDLLGSVLVGALERSGIDPSAVEQVVGGCVSQIGMQSANVTRNAWLSAGLPIEVAASTINSQCGSSQQATTVLCGLVGSGMIDVGMACGVEVMSAIPMGAVVADASLGAPRAGSFSERFEVVSQFEAADRIGAAWSLGRSELDELGLRSQESAAVAWSEQRFASQLVEVPATGAGDGTADGSRLVVDECLRSSSLEALAQLRTNLEEPGALHTAGTSSQIADGAAAVVLATPAGLDRIGASARAWIVDSVLVGSDPELMLTGPIPATRAVLERQDIDVGDIDLFEVNEAFAAVVLAWAKELGVDLDRVNPNGGAIAHGHPLGATGAVLLTKALHELERSGGRRALVTMCCGGGLGTATLIERAERTARPGRRRAGQDPPDPSAAGVRPA